jgi:hypothetical protein
MRPGRPTVGALGASAGSNVSDPNLHLLAPREEAFAFYSGRETQGEGFRHALWISDEQARSAIGDV